MPTPAFLNLRNQPEQLASQLLIDAEYYFAIPGTAGSGTPFTITDTGTVGKTINSYAGVPNLEFLSSTTTATDGSNIQWGTGSIIFQPGKRALIKVRFSAEDATNLEWAFGFAAADTSVIASDPTDHVMVRKLTGTLIPSVRLRKASGTAQTATLATPTALADNSWVDFHMLLTPDSTTVGAGKIELWYGVSALGNAGLTPIWSQAFGSQFPDTVALAPFIAYRDGAAADKKFRVAHMSVQVER